MKFSSEPEYIYEKDHREYWWNVSVKKATTVAHNKPYLIIWDRETKICSVIEFSCLLDINIDKKVKEKLENYGQLVENLQIMYPDYKFQVEPIVVSAMGSVSKFLTSYLPMIGFSEKESKVLIPKLVIKSIIGTVKICKTFLNFSDPFNNFD